MEAPGEPDPGGAAEPPAAFFGLWPKFADPRGAVPGVTPLQPRIVAQPAPRLRIA